MREEEREKKEIKTLIKSEIENLDRLSAEMEEYKGVNSKPYRRTKASVLADFYNCCERIFEIIAREIDGKINATQQWHKRLLYQMTMELKDIRPPILSSKLAAELDDYLSFRHLERNIYGFELEGERLDRLVEKFSQVSTQFQQEINDFLTKL